MTVKTLWIGVRLATLVGFKNRVSVMFKWAAAFLRRERARRVITPQQVFAGQAPEVRARESGAAS